MERIFSFLNYWLGKIYIPCAIPEDKQAHAISGLVLFGLISLFFGTELALIWLFIIATCKEIYDFLHPDIHTCDVLDIVATTAAPVMIFLIIELW